MVDSLSALELGQSGEMFVTYKLSRVGEVVVQMPQNSRYDLIVMRDEPVRIQVKAARQPSNGRGSYQFQTARGGIYQKHTKTRVKKLYTEGDYDLLAVVALDIERVLFLPPEWEKETRRIKRAAFEEQSAELSWLEALDTLHQK